MQLGRCMKKLKTGGNKKSSGLWDLECSSVIELLPSMRKTLSSIPSTARKKGSLLVAFLKRLIKSKIINAYILKRKY
jgi:hypothetical protein